jgi:hypothetical protein
MLRPRNKPSMKTFALLAASAALLVLGACKQETVVSGDLDDMKDQMASAKKVDLPPSVLSTKAYRCKDNSIVYIDLFVGDKMANVRETKDGRPVQLKADEAGKPMLGDGGYSVSGNGSALTVTRPGHGTQTCKA